MRTISSILYDCVKLSTELEGVKKEQHSKMIQVLNNQTDYEKVPITERLHESSVNYFMSLTGASFRK